MIGLTARRGPGHRPPSDRLVASRRSRLAVAAPAALGIARRPGADRRSGTPTTPFALGPLSASRRSRSAAPSSSLGGGVSALLRSPAEWGFGPLAPPAAAGRPGRLADPPAPPPDGWLRPGAMLGAPIVWAAVCLVAIPLVGLRRVVPAVGRPGQPDHRHLAARQHRSDPARPHQVDVRLPQRPARDARRVVTVVGLAVRPQAGLVLPGQLRCRDRGGDLRRGQPRGLVAGDPGHGVRGLAGVQAAQPRRWAWSSSAFAFQWMPWARIDRATFQYHYYAAVPFLLIALAYFLAELWHGPSAGTWALARLSAAAARPRARGAVAVEADRCARSSGSRRSTRARRRASRPRRARSC